MQINLKDKLRSLRLQKNITQEALANHLGITPQSVGKWERGEGFPDITLLPRIAFYFDITVDELLCVDQVRVEEAIAEDCNIVLHGHTHVRRNEYRNGVYLMNPGSAAQPRDGMPPSYAYIDYEKGGIFISHVSL